MCVCCVLPVGRATACLVLCMYICKKIRRQVGAARAGEDSGEENGLVEKQETQKEEGRDQLEETRGVCVVESKLSGMDDMSRLPSSNVGKTNRELAWCINVAAATKRSTKKRPCDNDRGSNQSTCW